MEYYSYIKAFHFLSFISWMAALFYLPRLFVYHSEHIENKDFVKVIKIQEEKLFYFIARPAMWGTLISGAFMLYLNPSLFSFGHIHAKLTFALLLVIYHYDNLRHLKLLKHDLSQKSGKFFRFYNEIPTLIMIAIIYVMIANPF